MPRILDNIEDQLSEALASSLQSSFALDTSVGYLNLRGWDQLADAVDAMPEPTDRPSVRLLVGMTGNSDSELRELMRISGPQAMDNARAISLKKELLLQ